MGGEDGKQVPKATCDVSLIDQEGVSSIKTKKTKKTRVGGDQNRTQKREPEQSNSLSGRRNIRNTGRQNMYPREQQGGTLTKSTKKG